MPRAAALGNMYPSGRNYLASIPSISAAPCKAIEGTIPPPSSFALAKPYWLHDRRGEMPIHPSTPQRGRSRCRTKDFSSGNMSEMVRIANQTNRPRRRLWNPENDAH